MISVKKLDFDTLLLLLLLLLVVREDSSFDREDDALMLEHCGSLAFFFFSRCRRFSRSHRDDHQVKLIAVTADPKRMPPSISRLRLLIALDKPHILKKICKYTITPYWIQGIDHAFPFTYYVCCWVSLLQDMTTG
jgi:hypothetical protein